jgi:Tfp pilus assembly protein PilX
MRMSRRLADQAGVALPVALAVLFTVAGLATVAARSAIVSGDQSLRDRNIKHAIQAANAGLNAARYQTNLMLPAANQCVTKDATTGDLSNAPVQADGWCAAQTEDLGDGAAYHVTVSQVSAANERTVVATGTAGGVSRRALLKMSYAAGGAIPLDRALLSQTSFTLENNVNVTGDVGSNGNITTRNNSSICGDLTPGPGQTWNQGPNSSVNCGGATSPATQPFAFPAVDQAGSQTTNDNGRLTSMKNNGPNPKDTCSNCGGISWNAATRVLDLDTDATLTLSGSVYNLCRLEMGNNNTLNISSRPSTTPMKIYIDTPENCGGGAGMGSVLIQNNSRIYYLGSSAKVIEIYVAGSTTTATSVNFNNNTGSGDSKAVLFLYGPNSDIRLYNNVIFHGSAIGKSLGGYNNEGLGNNVTVTYNAAIAALTPTTSQGYTSHSYRECTSSPTGATPDTGC